MTIRVILILTHHDKKSDNLISHSQTTLSNIFTATSRGMSSQSFGIKTFRPGKLVPVFLWAKYLIHIVQIYPGDCFAGQTFSYSFHDSFAMENEDILACIPKQGRGACYLFCY